MENGLRVLYVTGSCLTRNTSANMSHNAFVQGLLENDCDLDILMAKESWGEPDQGLPTWEKARYICFNSVSTADRLRQCFRGQASQVDSHNSNVSRQQTTAPKHLGLKSYARRAAKRAFYALFPKDPLYPLEKEWLKNASCYRSREKYDLVISNSSPAASHRLVEVLIQEGNISTDRWIQIWEDPWYHDLYGGHTEAEKQEEHRLLQAASEIVYVSPLTLMYQRRYFPDCADKMRCVPLPALKLGESDFEQQNAEEFSFGYFGDYYSATRDIKPFYEALLRSGFRGSIYGDSDLRLQSTDRIQVSGRVTLDVLREIQDHTDCLVHLSNLRGGQIPGKIYHYSVTNKPILFILDGTDEEQKALREFFQPYGRYVFCENQSEMIREQLTFLAEDRMEWKPVEDFFPANVVKSLIC